MKGKFNPKLQVGDEIILYHMDKESAVSPGTKGIVTKISPDPFETDSDGEIISVRWENGSTLALLSVTDVWKKVEPEILDEQSEKGWDYLTQNEDVLQYFDWRFLREFLYKIRESGIVNMYGAAPLLYSGRDHIDRYYGEGREDDESFQEVLEDAEEAKMKIILGVIDYMRENNKNLDDMNLVNNYAKNFSMKLLGLYIALPSNK